MNNHYLLSVYFAPTVQCKKGESCETHSQDTTKSELIQILLYPESVFRTIPLFCTELWGRNKHLKDSDYSRLKICTQFLIRLFLTEDRLLLHSNHWMKSMISSLSIFSITPLTAITASDISCPLKPSPWTT